MSDGLEQKKESVNFGKSFYSRGLPLEELEQELKQNFKWIVEYTYWIISE